MAVMTVGKENIMTISNEITKLNTNLTNSYTACQSKGATMPQNHNLDNLASCINSIPSGSSSALVTKTVTENGVYNANNDNADGYSSVTVNVQGGGNSKYGLSADNTLGDIDNNGILQHPSTSCNLVFTGVEGLGQEMLQYKFYNNPTIRTLSFPSLTILNKTQSMYLAFTNCSNLTTLDMGNLTTVTGYRAMASAFKNCTSLESIDLSNLVTVDGDGAMVETFSRCTSLESIDLSNLTTVGTSSALNCTFSYCSNLENIDISNVTTISGAQAMYYAFRDCKKLTSINLGNVTTINDNSMSYVFSGCTGITSVLFTNLVQIGQNSSTANYGQMGGCFMGCTNLTSITFPKLEKIYCTGGTTSSYGTFANNNKVQKMYFPKLDTITYGSGANTTNQNACKNVFYGCSDLTELHFAAANQSAIEASPGYSTLWGRGAGNATVYFDL